MPLQFQQVSGPAWDKVNYQFRSKFPDGFVQVTPTSLVLPDGYKQVCQPILDMDVRPDDIWVLSYPKTGTTWTQEMVWCIANNLDFEEAKTPLFQRFPFLEVTATIKPGLPVAAKLLSDSVGYVSNMAGPRYIKSHLPWNLLPRQLHTVQPKLVYVARNPKDVCVSYYNHSVLLESYEGTFQDFCEIFLEDKAMYSPFWSHLLEFWERRHQPNILFLKYEDMKKDLPSVIEKTARFLGKSLTPEQVADLNTHLSFANMKNNRAVNFEPFIEIISKSGFSGNNNSERRRFIRKGEVGDWKNHLSPDTAARFDRWTDENLQGTDFSFN